MDKLRPFRILQGIQLNTLKMKNLQLLPILLVIVCSCNQPSGNKEDHQGTTAAASEEWIQLFNGQNLDGWTIKMAKHPLGENFNHTFRVEDGLLKVRYDEYDRFDGEYGHIFYKNPYSHYKLRAEYRVVGEQVAGGEGWALKNNGVMYHAQSAESMQLDQDFPVSLEGQLLGGLGDGPRPTGNLCTPGTNVVMNGELITDHCINSTSQTYDGEQWVRFELVVYGDSIIHHIVNGDTVLTFEKPQIGGGNKPEDYPVPDGTPLSSGYIALQAESHPFDFRKVELLDLGVDSE
jgi:hypothetical protein